MTFETFKWIFFTCEVFTVIALLLCLYRFFHRSTEVKLLAVSFFSSTLTFVFANYLTGLDRNIPQNIWIIFDVLVLLAIYDVTWQHRYKAFSIVCAVAFFAFAIWNITFGQRIEFNSYTIALGGLIILVNCLLYFYNLLVRLPVQQLGTLPMFWFSTSFLFYFSGSLFIFAAYVLEVFRNSLLLYWGIQNLLRIIQFVLLIVGLCLDLRNMRTRPPLTSAS